MTFYLPSKALCTLHQGAPGLGLKFMSCGRWQMQGVRELKIFNINRIEATKLEYVL
jgi:hypothetical protein